MIGPGNRLAHAAALAVAELPGEAYNPLFLHGPPGLGKTHLLGAIVEYLRRNHPELDVHYTTAERFTTEFVAALRARRARRRFKARYRELDALLIDDVQVLEGKQRTEEEFVHTFNTLHAAGKQIVLSSDRPPEALSKLAERLRDRFDWGLRVELEPPDLRTRIALLWRIATGSATELPDPARAAGDRRRRARERPRARGRDDPGDGDRLAALRAAHDPDRAPGARQRRGRRRRADRRAARRSTAIQDAVCAVIGLTARGAALAARARRGSPAPASSRCTWRASSPRLSLAEIARAFDRDHTTVLHAIRSVTGRLEPGSETAGRHPQGPRQPGDEAGRDGPVHRDGA